MNTAQHERRIAVIRFTERFMLTHGYKVMLADLQAVVVCSEWNYDTLAYSVLVASPLLSVLEHGVIAPSVNVILNKETQKYEFVTGEA